MNVHSTVNKLHHVLDWFKQAKLFFPQVHLLVGVCSDELVLKYKAHPVLNSEERYESVRNCKWCVIYMPLNYLLH